MRRVLLGAIFVALLLLDLTAVSQTLSLIGLATVFGLVGHGAMWVPVVIIAVALTAGLIWLTRLTWRGLRSTPGERPTAS